MAVRWYCSLLLSAQHVVRLLAERHIAVTARTVLNWVQTFGPQLAAALRKQRRGVGQKWTVDEVFCFRGKQKLYLYQASDEHGQVIDVLLRNKRDRVGVVNLLLTAHHFSSKVVRKSVPRHGFLAKSGRESP